MGINLLAGGLVTGSAIALSSSIALAGCLSIVTTSSGTDVWNNSCGVGLNVIWEDDGNCSSRRDTKYPCAQYVAPHGTALIMWEGAINWHACESPGGSGDVLAVEHGWGNVICKD